MKLLCASEISLLKEMAKRASEMSLDELEDEEITDKEESDNNRKEKSGNYGTVEENMMYNPIVRDILSTFSHCLSLIHPLYSSAYLVM